MRNAPIPEFLKHLNELKGSVELALKSGTSDATTLHDLEVTKDALLDLAARINGHLDKNRRDLLGEDEDAVKGDLESWRQIEALNWGERFDHEGISQILRATPDLHKKLSSFAERAVGVLERIRERYKIPLGDAETTSNILYHIVGLGRDEFIKAAEDPIKVLATRARATPQTRDGYAPGFALAVQPPISFPPLTE
jgi:hypothetical protein